MIHHVQFVDNSIMVILGETATPVFNLFDSETNVLNIQNRLSFSYHSATPNIATYSNGVVTAESPGNVNVVVSVVCPLNYNKAAELFAILPVKVVENTDELIPLVSVSLSGPVKVEVAKTITLVPTFNPTNAYHTTPIFISENSSIASVNPTSGVVTGVKAGEVTISLSTKTVNNQTILSDYVVTVEGAAQNNATSIAIAPESGELKTNKTYNFSIVATPQGSSYSAAQWSSSNTNVASIDSNGTVTTKTTGNFSVTVTCGTLTDTNDYTVVEAGDENDENSFDGYYRSVKGLKGTALVSKLRSIVMAAGYSPNYDWSRYEAADEHPTDSTSIICIYARLPYKKNAHVSGSSGWNREHTFPQSKISSQAAKDNHHIFASDNKLNSYRGNDPFGKVDGTAYLKDSAGRTSQCKTGGSKFEPCDPAKGEVARSTMYLVVAYSELSITSNFQSLALCFEWNENFGVSARETRRNNVVQGFQKNRNPFIDFPEFARICFDPSYNGPGALM